MRTHTPWSLAAVLSLATLGLAGCEQDRDLKGLLKGVAPAETSAPRAEPTEAMGDKAGEPSPMEPGAKGGGPSATVAGGGAPGVSGASGATGVMGEPGKDHGCVRDDATKTHEVLGFLHATNRAEMVLAKLAVDRAQSDAVKEHARAVLRDHTDLDQRLAALAKMHEIDLEPATNDPVRSALSAARDAHLATLVGKTGKSFDADYVGPEASDHTVALKVVEQGQKTAKDADVVALLVDAHAVMLLHQEHALKLQEDLVMGGTTKAAPKAMGGGPTPTDGMTTPKNDKSDKPDKSKSDASTY